MTSAAAAAASLEQWFEELFDTDRWNWVSMLALALLLEFICGEVIVDYRSCKMLGTAGTDMMLGIDTMPENGW
eukprot:CAMPEP_0201628050 /NCGR_PEP_ID=MMETSP0493-20130528/3106_1 /ASSEMBLY_ACC=CAM_ASM_000838 /TAXON_ID=420259 /ORGANISM="Thalassiosira gravida, Strain GMp14c1" /LENGTH=72 /DNA_ID=CAMNT_0048098699 /DNA_START=1331 /DNA_END=1547 /DNA_ORIENTATION=+